MTVYTVRSPDFQHIFVFVDNIMILHENEWVRRANIEVQGTTHRAGNIAAHIGRALRTDIRSLVTDYKGDGGSGHVIPYTMLWMKRWLEENKPSSHAELDFI